MNLDNNIANKIRASFEGDKKNAPKELWSMIENSIDNRDLDNKVKTSFEEKQSIAPIFNFDILGEKRATLDDKISQIFEGERNVLPNSVWKNIEDRLDVNHVWENMANQIKISNFSWGKAIVASFILAFLSLFPPTSIKNPVTTSIFTTLQNYYPNGSIEQSTILAHNTSYTHTIRQTKGDDKNSNINLVPHVQNSSVFSPSIASTTNETVDLLVEHNSKIEDIALIRTPLHYLDYDITINKIESSEISMPKKNKGSSLKIGLTTGINNTWINNDDMRESFDKNSLLSSKLAFGISSGLTADYYFNDRIGISANYLFQCTSKNKIGYYENGFYNLKTTEINYTKGSLLFNFAKRTSSKNSIAKHVFSAGPYLAYNKNSLTTTGETITAYNTSYKKMDYGLKLQVGKEHQWSNFVLAYGLNSDIGLRNIIENQNMSSGELNLTTNFNFGLFTNLKYEF